MERSSSSVCRRGEYAVEAQVMGFQSLKEGLTVAGQNLQRNYVLKIGTLQEIVTLDFSANDPSNDAKDTPLLRQMFVPKPTVCVAPAGGYIEPPMKIRDAHPYYPSSLRGVWTEGTVNVRARIGVDGYVADVNIVGDAQPDLALSAMAAVREWRYTETLLNCVPVEVTMYVTVNFARRRQAR